MKRKLLQEALQRALEILPRHPEYENYKHYSFLIQDNKIVGFGLNRKGSPYPSYQDHCKIHSETDCYKQVKGILQKNKVFSIINLRLGKSGQLKNSRPCPCCFNFLRSVGCREVWFSTEVGFSRLQLN